MSAPRNPIRSKAKRLLGRFLDSIERRMGTPEDPDAIPDVSPAQWRAVSTVLATYRTLIDEHYMQIEAEAAKLDLSRVTVEEIHIIKARMREIEHLKRNEDAA